MGRLSMCLLLALAVVLPGCEAPGPVLGFRDTPGVNRVNFWDSPGSESRPVGPVTVWQWLDEHPGIVCTCAALLALGGIVVITGLAVHSAAAPFR